MYSQRYGTVPIVTRTGGLADSVDDWNARTGAGTGIVAPACMLPALQKAVERAFKLYADAKALRAVRRAGMGRDFSWAAAARAYEAVYERALGIQPASTP
jgi:starch synthase